MATETGDTQLLDTSRQRWDDMVAAKTSLTGGNGSRHEGESVRRPLRARPPGGTAPTTRRAPPSASFQWSWRLLLATGDAKYADHMERILYNGFARRDQHRRDAVLLRQPAAAPGRPLREGRPGPPPRVVGELRLLPAEHHAHPRLPAPLPGHQQRRRAHRPAVRHRDDRGRGADGGGRDQLPVGRPGHAQGDRGTPPGERELALRVPAWSSTAGLAVNDQTQSPERTQVPPDRYLRLRREWRAGDVVRLRLDMTPRWTYPDSASTRCAAAPRSSAARSCTALSRPTRRPGSTSCRSDRQAQGRSIQGWSIQGWSTQGRSTQSRTTQG